MFFFLNCFFCCVSFHVEMEKCVVYCLLGNGKVKVEVWVSFWHSWGKCFGILGKFWFWMIGYKRPHTLEMDMSKKPANLSSLGAAYIWKICAS